MKQLTPLDGQFLNMEFGNCYQHIGVLSIYDPSTASGGKVRFKDILHTFQSRLEHSPLFTQKLLELPLNLDFPYWVKDQNFDLEFHVRHIALPKPGDWRQLCIQVARLHSRPLDRARPLWEAYVIEGIAAVADVPANAYAVYLKFHHCMVDGMGSLQLYGALHDAAPQTEAGEYCAGRGGEAEPEPDWPRIAVRTWWHWVTEPRRIWQLSRMAIPTLSRTRNFRRAHELESPHAKVMTRFDQSISPHRVFGAVVLPLSGFRDIRSVVDGSTVNDVACSIVSLAVSKYLADKDELPSRSLKAAMPVSMRSAEDAASEAGNNIEVADIEIHTHLSEPLDVLRAVQRTTLDTKQFREAVGADLLVEISKSMPSALQSFATRASAQVTRLGRPGIFPSNLTITNVPGPPFHLYMTGAKCIKSFGVGIAQEGAGLFNIVTSYAGDISISFICCREQMPDPENYQQALRSAHSDLLAAAKSQIK